MLPILFYLQVKLVSLIALFLVYIMTSSPRLALGVRETVLLVTVLQPSVPLASKDKGQIT